MNKTKKVRLHLYKDDYHIFFKFAGASRFAYNHALNQDDLDNPIKESILRKEFTQFKKIKGNEWMKEINNNVFKQAIRDYCKARSNFQKSLSKEPKKKKRKYDKASFYVDVEQVKIRDNKIYIPSIGWFDYSGCKLPNYERYVENKVIYHKGIKPTNPRVSYDGLYWYISLSYEFDKSSNSNKDIKFGVDLGLKTFATICKRRKLKVDNKIKTKRSFKKFKSLKSEYKKIAKRKKRLDRKISKYNEYYKKLKKKGVVTKSKNYYKLLQKRIKLSHRMTNIQKDNIYKTISYMVKSKPSRIVIENLNVKGMMKNKRLAKWISFNQFYTFKRILEYKCEQNGIELIIADRFFPSSKLCSCCGCIKKKLSLSERTFICENCGFTMDRDENAALNLSRYSA